eukprot:TRINITY_DN11635_c0_g2_i1.p1 TRINITY_DN11635_c0_g2~~TRINITY_DN11635_c0_g2_i1.p1  ORF type:complete len:141 (+),score=47.68 TRINITY_DN11635_c0_g2_i1:105-527(+)
MCIRDRPHLHPWRRNRWSLPYPLRRDDPYVPAYGHLLLHCPQAGVRRHLLGYQIIKYYGKNKKESGMAAQSMISALSGRTTKVHDAINASMNDTHPLDVADLWAICKSTIKPYSLQLTFLQYCYFLSIHGPSTKLSLIHI